MATVTTTTHTPTRTRVVRYARDAGFAPVEWARAIAAARLDPSAPSGTIARVGVQLTKTRTLDVLIRLERLDTPGRRLRGAINRTESDRLFRSRGRLRRALPECGRALAVLSAGLAGEPVRLLIVEPGAG